MLLKSIAQPSFNLLNFITALDLSLNRPQTQHMARVADSLIVIEGSLTLSSLYRHIVDGLCPKAGADTF